MSGSAKGLKHNINEESLNCLKIPDTYDFIFQCLLKLCILVPSPRSKSKKKKKKKRPD